MPIRNLSLAMLLVLQTGIAVAQPAFVERKVLSTDAARTIVDTCVAFAAEHNLTLAVAVVDFAGVLLDFHMMEGGGPTTSETAILAPLDDGARGSRYGRRQSSTALDQRFSEGRRPADHDRRPDCRRGRRRRTGSTGRVRAGGHRCSPQARCFPGAEIANGLRR